MSSSESPAVGLRYVLVATAVAGVLGYAIQLLAPALIEDDAAYVGFSVFWSTLYFGVAAVAGVQQEITRATHPADSAPASPTLRTYALWMALAVGVAAIVVGFVFGPAVLPGSGALSGASVAVILVVGLVGYVFTAVLSGVLYGLRLWRAVAGITIADAVIRAVLVIGGLLLGLPTEWLALCVAIPFGAAFGLTWLVVRRHVIGRFRLDVPLRGLLSHTAGTVGAATASAAMITGLPMLIGVTSGGSDAPVIGAYILAITVTRAPIVVPIIALQSYLISVVFRGAPAVPALRILRMLGVLAAAVAVASVVGALIGPAVISFISAGRFALTGSAFAVIVVSAGLVAAMCLTSPALITARRHVANVTGWTVAAVLTIGALLLPIADDTRISLALIVPPVVGLLVHVLALARPASQVEAGVAD